jgi:hypothetical protein
VLNHTCRHDAVACTRLFDISCGHEMKFAYFHKLINCFVPAFGVIEQLLRQVGDVNVRTHERFCVLATPDWIPHKKFIQKRMLPSLFRDFVRADLLEPRGVRSEDVVFIADAQHGHTCHVLQQNATVTTWSGASLTHKARDPGMSYWESMKCHRHEISNGALMRHALARKNQWLKMHKSGTAAGALDLQSATANSTGSHAILAGIQREGGQRGSPDERTQSSAHSVAVVPGQANRAEPKSLWILIARKNSRRFVDLSRVARDFEVAAASRGALLSVFWGNVSYMETFDLFNAAQVVVGFHGAGHANALFMSKGKHVVAPPHLV